MHRLYASDATGPVLRSGRLYFILAEGLVLDTVIPSMSWASLTARHHLFLYPPAESKPCTYCTFRPSSTPYKAHNIYFYIGTVQGRPQYYRHLIWRPRPGCAQAEDTYIYHMCKNSSFRQVYVFKIESLIILHERQGSPWFIGPTWSED